MTGPDYSEGHDWHTIPRREASFAALASLAIGFAFGLTAGIVLILLLT